MKMSLKNRLVLATILAGISWLGSKLYGSSIFSDVFMIVASVFAAWPIAKKAISALRYRMIGIDLLVTIAVIGAIIIGEHWEAAAVSILFLLGEYLEARAIEKTRSALRSLLDLSPKQARVLRGGKEVEVLPNEIEAGELVVVKPGEKIAVDGVVKKGEAYVNQSSITGESMPISVKAGGEVYSGTIAESGFLEIEAKKIGKDTTFARILQLVEEAQDKKAKTQAFLERFAKYYTPGVMILAIIVFAITRDVYLSLTLLVIACPGALVIAVPVSIVAGIGNAAKNGVLIKGGDAIERAAKSKVVAFDKTGTLTVGKPEVVDMLTMSVDKRELLVTAASAEHYSEHPLAKAIIESAKNLPNTKLSKPSHSDIVIGKGVEVKLGGDTVLVGGPKLFSSHSILIPKEVKKYIRERQSAGQTVVAVSRNKDLLGVIAIADKVRKEAVGVVERLKLSGKRVVMLTGDNNVTAQAIAGQLGIDEYYADLLPEDKVSKINGLKESTYGGVIMVGDGVNDAPALATATLGVAVGGPGKDVAMETADMVLLSGDISHLDYGLRLSRATVLNMKQNIYFAVVVVFLLLVGVLVHVVILSSGMLLHVVSVLLVIFNALRLLRYSYKYE